ncbi:hypothetical protein SARC_08582 [Sphaeroforma arctica JP610]|uniref:Inosine/uridine-preferring nucleoside hydrolase domain-containing protein n=1 Tax=Sphaeroforma arctica JP610 TaxID=667725 RepID=A0A0L0FSR8_9EUKA|nr:hypothetical protein SARC_08582 [Sphaeroforma arctica JP610]KNC79008.1 hypothetical protein SARC_08582 [Sphaeroforma arctica JP610]|eukprot:XP_014152910.1 hypothetical protein SARC_08582 [Sphaeroforma arctica JP610]
MGRNIKAIDDTNVLVVGSVHDGPKTLRDMCATTLEPLGRAPLKKSNSDAKRQRLICNGEDEEGKKTCTWQCNSVLVEAKEGEQSSRHKVTKYVTEHTCTAPPAKSRIRRPSSTSSKPTKAKKIIFDTDIGIDDAMAAVFAIASPEIDLVAMTTVFGNATVENATRNALHVKDKFKLTNTVIAKGTNKPIVNAYVDPTVMVHGIAGLGDVDVPVSTTCEAIDTPAYQYIIDSLKADPNNITLVAVGPLTNLALALAACPEITKLVKEVVIMGGAFGLNEAYGNKTSCAEANVYLDPHAADKVFTADWPVVIVGLDVTQKCIFTHDFIDNLRTTAGEMGQFVWDVSRFYLKFYSEIVGLTKGCHVHDPSAIAYVIKPDLFTLRKGPVRVVCEGVAAGLTIQKLDRKRYHVDNWSPHRAQCVAVDVCNEELVELYRSTLVAYAKKQTE